MNQQTIVFLTWKPNQPEVWEDLIQRFHRKNPEIRVQVQVGPHSSTEYHAIVTQRLKNKDTSVDVFFMDVIWPPEFASAGWALDLTSRFSREQKKFLARANHCKHLSRQHIWRALLSWGRPFLLPERPAEQIRFQPPDLEGDAFPGKAIIEGERIRTPYLFGPVQAVRGIGVQHAGVYLV